MMANNRRAGNKGHNTAGLQRPAKKQKNRKLSARKVNTPELLAISNKIGRGKGLEDIELEEKIKTEGKSCEMRGSVNWLPYAEGGE